MPQNSTAVSTSAKVFKVLFGLSVFFLVLGQFSLLSRNPNIKLYSFDVSAVFFSLISITYLLFIKYKFSIPKVYFFYLLFCIICILSLVVNLYRYNTLQFLYAASYLFRLGTFVFLGIGIFGLIRQNILSSGFIINALMNSSLALSILGFVQLILLPDFRVLDPALGWDPHVNRLASTFFDPNFLGGYLGLCICIFLGQYFYGYKWKNYQWFLYFVIPTIALCLTFSRSAWALFAVVIFLYGILRARYLLLLGVFVAFTAYYAVPRVQTRLAGTTDPSDSASFRIISWNSSLEIFNDNPLLGIGFNSYKYSQISHGFLPKHGFIPNSASGADSSFLFVLATTGLVGFLIFLCAYLYSMSVSPAYFVFFSGLFIQTQFINAFFYAPVMFLIFVYLSVELSKKLSFLRK